jgi:hypothetical protein
MSDVSLRMELLNANIKIKELEKANDTLHKLMVSGEKRGMDKATQEFELSSKDLIEEFAEAECMGDLAKIARNHGYDYDL